MSKNDFIVGLRILGIDTNIDENDDCLLDSWRPAASARRRACAEPNTPRGCRRPAARGGTGCCSDTSCRGPSSGRGSRRARPRRAGRRCRAAEPS